MSVPVLSLPFNLLKRPEDKGFIMLLTDKGESKDYARLVLMLMWIDYAQNGNERVVPLDAGGRARSLPVRVLEDVCEWAGAGREPGALVAMAIESGVMKVVEDSATHGRLVLVGFAASARGATGFGGDDRFQDKGARAATRVRTATAAAKDAAAHMDLFNDSEHELMKELGRERFQRASVLLFQVCRIMDWKKPDPSLWTTEIYRRADEIRENSNEVVVNAVLEFLAGNKDKDELPGRLDLLLARWDTLKPRIS